MHNHLKQILVGVKSQTVLCFGVLLVEVLHDGEQLVEVEEEVVEVLDGEPLPYPALLRLLQLHQQLRHLLAPIPHRELPTSIPARTWPQAAADRLPLLRSKEVAHVHEADHDS